ncbi:hypothetical protein SLEP1_g48740 [Rubroshorea leprosula]|uniref:Uncharacterized protein n=1 Tax=Rubroshorea leprosula TaxID=152421 RepID=A0AAV5LXM5_9ROSI|nr:hypothetical protein SLEP1_g48740 [Rubroshorea leprosula]
MNWCFPSALNLSPTHHVVSRSVTLSVGLSSQSLSFLSSSPLPHSCSNSALISTDLHSDSLQLSTSPSLQPLASAALQCSPLTSS